MDYNNMDYNALNSSVGVDDTRQTRTLSSGLEHQKHLNATADDSLIREEASSLRIPGARNQVQDAEEEGTGPKYTP